MLGIPESRRQSPEANVPRGIGPTSSPAISTSGPAEAWVGEGLGPAAEGLVGGDRDGVLLLAFGEDLEHQFGAAPIQELILCTWMRKGEALALHWADVDLDAQVLLVREVVVARSICTSLAVPWTAAERDRRAVWMLRLPERRRQAI
jgi:hypothetical protein